MSCVTLMRWGNAESALVPAVGFKGNDSVRFGREVDPVGGVVADVPVVNRELEGASADGEIPPGAALHMSAGGTDEGFDTRIGRRKSRSTIADIANGDSGGPQGACHEALDRNERLVGDEEENSRKAQGDDEPAEHLPTAPLHH